MPQDSVHLARGVTLPVRGSQASVNATASQEERLPSIAQTEVLVTVCLCEEKHDAKEKDGEVIDDEQGERREG